MDQVNQAPRPHLSLNVLIFFEGSFDISGGKSLRPLVVHADFEPLPSTAADRTAQLAENGLF